MIIENFINIFETIVPFLVILTILVFVHELGHYLIARYNSVKVEVFSIGFGKEIFGFDDKNGTRWKFSLIPLGGYVKMHGDDDEASSKAKDESRVDKSISFHHKTVGQRSAILFAGPAANYIFSFVLLIFINFIYGLPVVKPIISEVIPNEGASIAGLKKDDLILSINNQQINEFNDIRGAIENNNNSNVIVSVSRDNKIIDFEVKIKNNILGIRGSEQELRESSFIESVSSSLNQITMFTITTLKGIYEIFVGKRGTDELGGPIRIAELSSDFWEKGLQSTLWFMVLISLNLGLINLFPIPLLDGGHLLFNFIEVLKGKPLGKRSLEVFHSIGLFLLVSLMIFATFNDISRFLN